MTQLKMIVLLLIPMAQSPATARQKTLFQEIGTTNKFCVEFGAGDGYTLSNTRYFLENGWKGLMMDIEPGHESVVQENINADNINELFKKHNVPKFKE